MSAPLGLNNPEIFVVDTWSRALLVLHFAASYPLFPIMLHFAVVILPMVLHFATGYLLLPRMLHSAVVILPPVLLFTAGIPPLSQDQNLISRLKHLSGPSLRMRKPHSAKWPVPGSRWNSNGSKVWPGYAPSINTDRRQLVA